jgi:SpoVK/Ycf46/Vps4 family AAA+-type ATPase
MSSICITSADNVAESAAESLHRPLYYISGAELGMLHDIHAGSMEDNLELIFKRIARWEAILLFDEAESFVASRQSESHNAQKNALTSVLLRMLEYQSGIIFLTTNRVSDFDTALFSRVHITLAFEALTSTHCRFIWKKLAAQTDHDITEDDFDRLSQIPLDGRTIKNVLRVASLQTKIRERQNEGVPAKMNMADVKAVFPYAVGASENTEIGQKMKVLYAS